MDTANIQGLAISLPGVHFAPYATTSLRRGCRGAKRGYTGFLVTDLAVLDASQDSTNTTESTLVR